MTALTNEESVAYKKWLATVEAEGYGAPTRLEAFAAGIAYATKRREEEERKSIQGPGAPRMGTYGVSG